MSRISTSASTDLKATAPKSGTHFEASLNCMFERKQLQKKFKHAADFGILGNYSQKTVTYFKKN